MSDCATVTTYLIGTNHTYWYNAGVDKLTWAELFGLFISLIRQYVLSKYFFCNLPNHPDVHDR